MTSSDRPDFSNSQKRSTTSQQQLADSAEQANVRSAPEVLQDLDRLDDLLARANRSLDDAAVEGRATEDRRRDERRNVFTEIVIVQSDSAGASTDSEAFDFMHGQTLNLSVSGVAFVTPKPLVGDSHVALLRHPDFPAPRCCFELMLFRSRQLTDGQWEHGAVLRPLVPGPATRASAGRAHN